MRIANHAVAALSSLILAIGGVDGSRGSTAINVEDPYLFLGLLSLRNGGGETDAPTAAPTSAPTTADSSIQCPTGLYNHTAYLSGDCTKAGICYNGDLQQTTIVECDVAAGQIYNVDCGDPDTSGFLGCCTSEEGVTCPTPSPTSSPSASPTKTPVRFRIRHFFLIKVVQEFTCIIFSLGNAVLVVSLLILLALFVTLLSVDQSPYFVANDESYSCTYRLAGKFIVILASLLTFSRYMDYFAIIIQIHTGEYIKFG